MLSLLVCLAFIFYHMVTFTRYIEANFTLGLVDCVRLTPASQVEVGCPWARGLQPQYTPRRKNTHRPTNPQPSHEPPRAKPKGPPGRKPGVRGLGAAEPQAPRAQT